MKKNKTMQSPKWTNDYSFFLFYFFFSLLFSSHLKVSTISLLLEMGVFFKREKEKQTREDGKTARQTAYTYTCDRYRQGGRKKIGIMMAYLAWSRSMEPGVFLIFLDFLFFFASRGWVVSGKRAIHQSIDRSSIIMFQHYLCC